MEITDSCITLTFDELRILLYSQGFRQCEGVYMPEREFDSGDIINSLQVLVKNRLLTVEQDSSVQEALPLVFGDDDQISADQSDNTTERFFVRSDLLTMIKIIGEPDSTEILMAEDGRKTFCYYSADGVVTSERIKRKKDTVRLKYFDQEDFDEYKREIEEGNHDNSNGGDPDHGYLL